MKVKGSRRSPNSTAGKAWENCELTYGMMECREERFKWKGRECRGREGKTRQGKTVRGRQGNSRQDKTREGKVRRRREGKVRLGKEKEGKGLRLWRGRNGKLQLRCEENWSRQVNARKCDVRRAFVETNGKKGFGLVVIYNRHSHLHLLYF